MNGISGNPVSSGITYQININDAPVLDPDVSPLQGTSNVVEEDGSVPVNGSEHPGDGKVADSPKVLRFVECWALGAMLLNELVRDEAIISPFRPTTLRPTILPLNSNGVPIVKFDLLAPPKIVPLSLSELLKVNVRALLKYTVDTESGLAIKYYADSIKASAPSLREDEKRILFRHVYSATRISNLPTDFVIEIREIDEAFDGPVGWSLFKDARGTSA